MRRLITEVNTGSIVDQAKSLNWSYWEIFREFVQNAMDASGPENIHVSHDGTRLIIRDTGKGLDILSFLLGKSTKSEREECYRGRFGNGMKFAMLTCLLLDLDIWIRSYNETFHPVEKEKIFTVRGKQVPEKVVVIEQYEEETSIDGTLVEITGFPYDHFVNFRSRILFHNDEDAYRPLFSQKIEPPCENKPVFYNEILEHKREYTRRTVFVRDIYIKDYYDMLYSYNLYNVRLDVSRNIPESMSLNREIVRVWASCSDVKLLSKFFKKLSMYPGTFEYTMSWDFQDVSIAIEKNRQWHRAMKVAFPEYYDEEGDRLFFYCEGDIDIAKIAEYYSENRYRYLWLPDSLLRRLHEVRYILSAEEIIKWYSATKTTIIPDSQLGKHELANLKFLRRLFDACNDRIALYFDQDPKPANIKAISTPENDVLGKYIRNKNIIGITYKPRNVLGSLIDSIETLSHEVLHHYGVVKESNTLDFAKKQIDILLIIIRVLMDGKIRKSKDIKL